MFIIIFSLILLSFYMAFSSFMLITTLLICFVIFLNLVLHLVTRLLEKAVYYARR